MGGGWGEGAGGQLGEGDGGIGILVMLGHHFPAPLFPDQGAWYMMHVVYAPHAVHDKTCT